MLNDLAVGSLRFSFRANTPSLPLTRTGKNVEMLRKYLLGLIIFVFSLSVPSPSRSQENLSEIVKRIKPSVVVILTYDKDGKGVAQGSGFFVSKEGEVITNRHVLEGASRAEIRTQNGKTYFITRVVAEDKESDLVRVSVDLQGDSASALQISAALPLEGERIIVIGSPLGLEQSVSDGIISAVREISGYGNIVQITAPISPGSSGSPVVNMKSEVIGVATFVMREGQNVNFAIPSERFGRLGHNKEQTLAEWEAGRVANVHVSAEDAFRAGIGLVQTREWADALFFFFVAVKENPLYAEAYLFMGICSDELGYNEKAIEAFNQAIKIKPDNAYAYYGLGSSLRKVQRYQEAVEAFKQAIKIKPDYADAHHELGGMYQKLGRNQEGLEAFKQAIRIKPDNAESYYGIGLIYMDLKRYQGAIEAYKQTVRIKPDHDRAHLGLALIYVRLERYQEAMEAYKQVIRIGGENYCVVQSHLGLGICYLALGDKGSALDEYKILKNLDASLANRLFSLIYN